MADPTVDPKPVDPTPDPKPEVISLTQDEFNKKIEERLARERQKFSDYEALKKKAETLEAEIKKREEAELTELDKIKKQYEETKAELETHKSNTEWRMNWETKEAEAIEKEMEDLTDNQKTIVNALPLESRRSAINEFKATSDTPAPRGRKGGAIDGVPTLEEVSALRTKFGANSKEYREAYLKYSAGKY